MKKKLSKAAILLLIASITSIVLWRAGETMLVNAPDENRLIGILFFTCLSATIGAMTARLLLELHKLPEWQEEREERESR